MSSNENTKDNKVNPEPFVFIGVARRRAMMVVDDDYDGEPLFLGDIKNLVGKNEVHIRDLFPNDKKKGK